MGSRLNAARHARKMKRPGSSIRALSCLISCPAYFGLQNTMKSSVCFGMFFSEPMYFA